MIIILSFISVATWLIVIIVLIFAFSFGALLRVVMAATCLKKLVTAFLIVSVQCTFSIIIIIIIIIIIMIICSFRRAVLGNSFVFSSPTIGVRVGTLIYAWYTRQRGKLPYYAFMIIFFTLYLSLV